MYDIEPVLSCWFVENYITYLEKLVARVYNIKIISDKSIMKTELAPQPRATIDEPTMRFDAQLAGANDKRVINLQFRALQPGDLPPLEPFDWDTAACSDRYDEVTTAMVRYINPRDDDDYKQAHDRLEATLSDASQWDRGYESLISRQPGGLCILKALRRAVPRARKESSGAAIQALPHSSNEAQRPPCFDSLLFGVVTRALGEGNHNIAALATEAIRQPTEYKAALNKVRAANRAKLHRNTGSLAVNRRLARVFSYAR